MYSFVFLFQYYVTYTLPPSNIYVTITSMEVLVMKDIQVRNQVKQLRLAQGNMTQNDLAKQVGVTRQTMHLIENNKYNPTIRVCLLIAKALNTSIDQLFWMEESM